jgi:prepilin-type N-terminal cleavage/methylation domain-containing protein/prepilin-type processing-associated H-X9-DG protein
MRARRAFTLLEIMAAIIIIAILVGLLIPALSAVRRAARRADCLNHLRNLGQAHGLYMGDHRGRIIDVGLPHGGALANENISWITTLRRYYDNDLVLRSPVDTSPHWPTELGGAGFPIPGTSNRYRYTSYGCNAFLSASNSPRVAQLGPGAAADRLSKVHDPANTVHFLIIAFTGSHAGSDYVSPHEWAVPGMGPAAAPIRAARQSQIDAHGGPKASLGSISSYAFLDGHVEALQFSEVYLDADRNNRFDPEVSRFFAARRSGS